MVPGLGEAVAAAHRLVRIAILEQFDHGVVELDEPDIESLCAAPEIGDPDRPWIDPPLAGFDVLVSQQGVVNALTLEVTVAHDLGTTEHLCIELVGAVHVLHGQSKVLGSLQPGTERCGVAIACGGPGRRTGGLGQNRRSHCEGGGSGSCDRGPGGMKHLPAVRSN